MIGRLIKWWRNRKAELEEAQFIDFCIRNNIEPLKVKLFFKRMNPNQIM